MSPSILILYCGGTIGMTTTEKGFCPDAGFHATLDKLLEKEQLANIDIMTMDTLIDSAAATPTDWLFIINTIIAYKEQYDGFVILHGTDTLSYSAAALALWLDKLHKPIIITGAQRPMICADSDGLENVLGAIHYAQRSDFQQVGIYFGHYLLNPRATRKIDAQADNAFMSPNAKIWGQKIAESYELYSADIKQLPTIAPLSALPVPAENMQDNFVGLCHISPAMPNSVIKAMFAADVRALVLLSYGVGNFPSNPLLLSCLQSAIAEQKLIINCTQCLYGHTAQSTYAAGIADEGVIEGKYASYEYAYVLCYFAQRLNLSRQTVIELLEIEDNRETL